MNFKMAAIIGTDECQMPQSEAQSDLPFRSRCDLKIFKMAAMMAISDIKMELL